MTNKMMTWLTASMLIALTACSKGDKASPSNPDEPQAGKGIVAGKVVDEQGKPVSGVKIYADHTEYYNTNVITTTDANGKYKLDISNLGGTYRVHGELMKTYNGIPYRFDVYTDDALVNSTDGGVRNLTWKLSGIVPGTLNSTIGGLVNFHQTFGNEEYWEWQDVEMTLVPVGNLVDGSVGKTIVQNADGFPERIGAYNNVGLNDVPVGRYKISMRYVPKNAPAVNLVIKLRDDDEYVPEITADFQQREGTGFQEIPLDIKFP